MWGIRNSSVRGRRKQCGELNMQQIYIYIHNGRIPAEIWWACNVSRSLQSVRNPLCACFTERQPVFRRLRKARRVLSCNQDRKNTGRQKSTRSRFSLFNQLWVTWSRAASGHLIDQPEEDLECRNVAVKLFVSPPFSLERWRLWGEQPLFSKMITELHVRHDCFVGLQKYKQGKKN